MRDNPRGNNVTAEFCPGWRLADFAVRAPFDFGQHALKLRPNHGSASQLLLVTQVCNGGDAALRRLCPRAAGGMVFAASSCATERGAVIAAG
jgi:hypothetical protein